MSRDEEFVELQLRAGGRTIDVGARAFNYMLLTLARRRIQDTKEGVPDSSCGWVYTEDLARALRVPEANVNLDVFRIRKSLEALGVAGAANIIERRPPTRQLRIGANRFVIAIV